MDIHGWKADFHFGEFGRATKRWEYQGMRSLKSKLKASVYWRTRGQFWKLNQVQLFCNQNERKPIRFLLFNARACDRTGSRDWIRWSGNRPENGLQSGRVVAVTSSFSYSIVIAVHTRKTAFSNSTIFKSFHSGERFQIDPFSLVVFGAVVWTVAVSGTKHYRSRLKTVYCVDGI